SQRVRAFGLLGTARGIQSPDPRFPRPPSRQTRTQERLTRRPNPKSVSVNTSMNEISKSRPPLTWRIKILFSVGAMANGIKYRTLGALLLSFYNQVMGMSPAIAASAIFIVTICDAVFDPLVGYMSDNLRSKYGRRHPFMYLSGLPLGLTLF